VFHVRYELNFYINLLRNSVFKGLNILLQLFSVSNFLQAFYDMKFLTSYTFTQITVVRKKKFFVALHNDHTCCFRCNYTFLVDIATNESIIGRYCPPAARRNATFQVYFSRSRLRSELSLVYVGEV
jgi:hypothetical protein